MKKAFFYTLAAIFILGSFSVANAANPFDISYPIPELGNCASQDECKLFCDDSANQNACLVWASDNGFVPKEEVEEMKRKMEEMKRFERGEIPAGPGGCSSQQECDTYCSEPENNDECFDFGVEHGFIPPEEAERIRADRNRTGPGGCSSREECDAFCSNPNNTEICMNSAVEDGMMTQEEADFILRMMEREKEFRGGPRGLPAGRQGPHGPRGPHGPGGPDDDFDEEKARELIESGEGGPGGCSTMDECENYCSEPDNNEECMNFAIEHGLIPPEQAEKMKKILEIGGPGGCSSQQECDAYCSEPENNEECFNFARDNDLIPPEELEMIEKMMDKGGPGGCRGERECDEYCQGPEHAEECIMFSVDMGMMTQDEAEKMVEHMRKMEERMMQREGDFMRMKESFGPNEGGFGPPGGDFGPPKRFEDRRGHDDNRDFMPPPFGGEMPTPDEFPGRNGEFPGKGDFSPQREFPGKDFMPRDGMMPEEGFGEFMPREKFEDMRFREEGENKFEEFHPEGFIPREFENFIPPEGDFIEQEEIFEEKPVSFRKPSLFGTVLGPFLDIFR